MRQIDIKIATLLMLCVDILEIIDRKNVLRKCIAIISKVSTTTLSSLKVVSHNVQKSQKIKSHEKSGSVLAGYKFDLSLD